MMKRLVIAASALVTSLLVAAPASAQEFRPGADANGDGVLSVDEYVIAHATADLRRFDKDEDDVISVEEWLANDNGWRATLLRRFNTDGNDTLSSEELVEIYLFLFGNRDKDESGTMSIDEAPGLLVRRS